MQQSNRTPPSKIEGLAAKKKKLPPFVSKLYTMVEDAGTNHIISWGNLPSQDSFVVHRVEELTTDILPLYFKHSNFCSFIRQVNTYGFTKTSPDTWEFQNPFFAKGRPDLLERIERRTSVKRSSEKEENGQENEHRMLKVNKTSEQVELLTRENKLLADELSKIQQESVMNEQLVKQFLLELKASKQRQREMQEREEKLLNVLRELAGGSGSGAAAAVQLNLYGQQPQPSQQQQQQQHPQMSVGGGGAHPPPRIQMPTSTHMQQHQHHHQHPPHNAIEFDHSEMDSSECDPDLEAYMLKLGLSAREAAGGVADHHHHQHQHQQHTSYNPPSPFQVPLMSPPFSTPPSTPPQSAATHSAYVQPATPPQSPFTSWSAAPASPSYFFTNDSEQSFKFGESYLSTAVGEWPGYSLAPASVKQEPVCTDEQHANKEACEEFLERYLDGTAATFSALPPTPDSSVSSSGGMSSLSTPASSPFIVSSPSHDALGGMDDPNFQLRQWGEQARARERSA